MAITGAILTSLNVVNIALLAWDSSKRSAIRARKRLIGTRSSGRLPIGIGVLGNVAAFAPPATALSASPLVTRPSRPEPATWSALRLCSARIFVAEGAAAADDLAAGAAFVGATAGAAEATGAAATAVLSIFAINCSAITVPPSAITISVITPADGEGTSSTTLSVSISIKISS